MNKNALASGKQIIRSKNGLIVVRVSTLITKDHEQRIQELVDELGDRAEKEFMERAGKILGIEMRKR
jgi:hypothetical protein